MCDRNSTRQLQRLPQSNVVLLRDCSRNSGTPNNRRGAPWFKSNLRRDSPEYSGTLLIRSTFRSPLDTL